MIVVCLEGEKMTPARLAIVLWLSAAVAVCVVAVPFVILPPIILPNDRDSDSSSSFDFSDFWNDDDNIIA